MISRTFPNRVANGQTDTLKDELPPDVASQMR